MKIGLLVQRATDLKWAGPFSEEALKREHEVLLLLPAQPKGSVVKAYLTVNEDQLTPLRERGVVTYPFEEHEISDLERGNFDVVVMQEGFHSQNDQLGAWQALREKGIKLYSLSHFFEICKRPLEALDYFDATVYVSPYARELHQRLLKISSQKDVKIDEDEAPAFSSPMFDQIPSLSREESRRQLGLDLEAKVVLLIAPVILPTTPWRFHVWRDGSRLKRLQEAWGAGHFNFSYEILFGHTFRQVFDQITQFAKQNEACLIVKSRGKQKNLDFVEQGADHFEDGLSDRYYPNFSTYQLMAAADLCITVNSMAAMEAAVMGIPVVNIAVPVHDRAENSTREKEAYNRELLGNHQGGILNYAGTVSSVDRREALAFFKQSWPRIDFSPNQGAQYGSHFLGIDSKSASTRMLEHMEALS